MINTRWKSKNVLRRLLLMALVICFGITSIQFSNGASYAISKPKAPKITSTKAVKNEITVKFKKVKKAKKYQVAYKQASKKKWSKVNTKKCNLTIKKLKYATKYDIKVRAYNGKWGKWSKTKTLRTKAKATATKPQEGNQSDKPGSGSTAPDTKPNTGDQPTSDTGHGDQPSSGNWKSYTKNGSSIEWMVDGEHTLHIRPISGDVGIISDQREHIPGSIWGDPGAAHHDLNDAWKEYNGIKKVTVDRGTIQVKGTANALFEDLKNVTSIDISKFDTSNVDEMDQMFKGCSSLKSLNVSKLDTSNVTSMSGMFAGCSSLSSLDLSNFETGNVEDMGGEYDEFIGYRWGMFEDCSSLTSLDLSSFNTKNVESMAFMFAGCKNLENLNLSNFNTKNLNSRGMFTGCFKIKRLIHRQHLPFGVINRVTGYEENEITDWDEDAVWDNDGGLLYGTLVLKGIGGSFPLEFTVDFGVRGATYNITDSDKTGYTKKLTANYEGVTRVWYVKYEMDYDAIFYIEDIVGYDEDETENLISEWDVDTDGSLLGELVLRGIGENIPSNLIFTFGHSGVSYKIEESDKTGYVKKLTASFGGKTRVCYVKYERDYDALFYIEDIIGYEVDETNNQIYYSGYDTPVYNYDELLYRELTVSGTGKSLPSKIKVVFAVPGVTYSITDSDKEGYAKKLIANYGNETRVWYIKYESSYFDELFEIQEIIGYDENETKNLIVGWYERGKGMDRELVLNGVGGNLPSKLKVDFAVSEVTYNVTDSDKPGYDKKLTASYGSETRVWFIKYESSYLDETFEIQDIIGYDEDEAENLISDWYEKDLSSYKTIVLQGAGEKLPTNLKVDFAVSGVTYNVSDSDKQGFDKKLTANYGDATRVWYINYIRD